MAPHDTTLIAKKNKDAHCEYKVKVSEQQTNKQTPSGGTRIP